MVAPLPRYCLAPNQSFNPNRITLHDYVVVCSIIPQNLQNLQFSDVDSNKIRPLEFGDAIATLTNNNKPTGPSFCLGGFVFVENLSTH